MDGRLSRIVFCGAIWIALSIPGLAKADAVNAEWNSTTRALSMGNIGIASADDPTAAAFYNPAALARAKKVTVEIFNPQLDLGGGMFALAKGPQDWYKQTSYSGVRPALHDNPYTATSSGFSMFPNFSAQNFSFGVLVANGSSAYYDARKDAYFFHSRKLVVPSLGLSMSWLGGRFRIGVSARAVQITEVTIVDPGTYATVSQVQKQSDGYGVGGDAGMLFTLPWYALPTLGFVARNAGNISFTSPPFFPLGKIEDTRHERAKMMFDGGLSFTPKMGRGSQFTFAVDYRDATNVSGTPPLRHANIGFEYGAFKLFYFRAGYSQGYWTAGFGLDSKSGAVDLGTYGEELTNSFQGQLNRRYSLRLTRRF